MQEVEGVAETGHYSIMYKDCFPSLVRIGHGFQNFVFTTGFHHVGIVSVYTDVIFSLPTTSRFHCQYSYCIKSSYDIMEVSFQDRFIVVCACKYSSVFVGYQGGLLPRQEHGRTIPNVREHI